jgi:DNA-binding transcriptional MerR regulator
MDELFSKLQSKLDEKSAAQKELGLPGGVADVTESGLAVLPPIPAKRYFTIGEVSELCAVKPHVLRYWEQEFTQLRPMKRRGNRRYYQHHEVLLVRRIRELLYEQGFTISGARNRLGDAAGRAGRVTSNVVDVATEQIDVASSKENSVSYDVIAEVRNSLIAAIELLKPTSE